jgi:hypothetical protein
VSPSERERIRAQVRESRQRQGLPEHVEDTTVLDRLAGRLLEQKAAPADSACGATSTLTRNGGPGSSPGRRDHPAAAKQQKGRGQYATVP